MPEKKTKPSEPAPKEMLQVLAQRVSVVVPLGPNRAVEMHRLEKGLLAQTIQPKEVVVEQGNHHYKNRNRGWQKAKGEMIWFLDSDIVPDSDAFERALEVFMTTETDAVEGHIYGVIERVFKWGFMSGHIFTQSECSMRSAVSMSVSRIGGAIRTWVGAFWTLGDLSFTSLYQGHFIRTGPIPGPILKLRGCFTISTPSFIEQREKSTTCNA